MLFRGVGPSALVFVLVVGKVVELVLVEAGVSDVHDVSSRGVVGGGMRVLLGVVRLRLGLEENNNQSLCVLGVISLKKERCLL